MNKYAATVLLIDDDEIDREHVRRLLSSTYQMHDAATGIDGLSILDKLDPLSAVVLLDYRLPDIDSFDILRKAVAQDIPVIVLTGEERPDIIVLAMQQGAQDYLIKNQLSIPIIERAISNAIEKAELKRNVVAQQRQIELQADALTEQNIQIRTLASALTLAEQRERKRIAQILHDYVQQLLFGVQIRLKLLSDEWKKNPDSEIPQYYTEAIQLLSNAISAARSLSVDLSPPILKDEGTDVSLRWLATHMEQVYGLKVNLKIDEQKSYRIENQELFILVFQLARELLFNVVKHANVKEADLSLIYEDGVQKIIVEDKGVGFEVGKIVQPKWKPEQGFGLYSIRERLALFGGKIEIVSHPNNGARITIILPQQFGAI